MSVEEVLGLIEMEYELEVMDCADLSVTIRKEDNIVFILTCGQDTGYSYKEWDMSKIGVDKLDNEMRQFIEEIIASETKFDDRQREYVE